MTVLTMRREHGEFVVTGPDISPSSFEPGARRGTGAHGIIPVHRSRRSGPTHPINRPGRGRRSGVECGTNGAG
jgi:hypothetical protein